MSDTTRNGTDQIDLGDRVSCSYSDHDISAFAAYVFDVSIQDVFTTLTRGGCICVPSEQQRINNLEGTIRTMNANWTCITPTVARLINPVEVPSLQTLILVGEPVTQKIVDQWVDKVPNLYNGYGPTESTLYCAVNPNLGKKGER